MIDSHCHLDFPQFDSDRQQVLKRCAAQGVRQILIPGTQASRWQTQIELCHDAPQLHFALGLHPYFLAEYVEQDLNLLTDLLIRHRGQVRAVGEIGLDCVIDVPLTRQQQVFEQQLVLASEFDLPVIVHHRKSHNPIFAALKQHALPRGGVIHAFSGSWQEATRYLELGFKLGIGGIITYPRAKKTRDLVSRLPLDAILLETDAPDMPLCGRQGQRNSPEYLPEVFASLVDLRREPVQQLALACEQNVTRLFALPRV